jgi:glycosyltransferase involved in cell wall biosynthesis
MTLVILYEEIAGYFISCLNHFAAHNEVDIHLFQKKPNAVAPFELKLHSKIKLYNREDYDQIALTNLINDIEPTAIFSGGWSYKPYLNICSSYNNSIPVCVGFDNQWNGNLKQRLVSLFGKSFIKKHFNSCFVPGEKQKTFAEKLGFKSDQISLNAYCCDHNLFSELYQTYKLTETNDLPKRLLYVGRYASEKGIETLWQAFTEIESSYDWELWCVGKGDITPISHPKIKHLGFIQPHEMDQIIENTSVMVLPSSFEPWGVVIHEYATAGYPLICSKEVGASELFIEEGINGFLFDSGNVDQLKFNLKKIFELDTPSLLEMSKNSHSISKKITNEIWSQTFFKVLSD